MSSAAAFKRLREADVLSKHVARKATITEVDNE